MSNRPGYRMVRISGVLETLVSMSSCVLLGFLIPVVWKVALSGDGRVSFGRFVTQHGSFQVGTVMFPPRFQRDERLLGLVTYLGAVGLYEWAWERLTLTGPLVCRKIRIFPTTCAQFPRL